jgi:hypothetical protein
VNFTNYDTGVALIFDASTFKADYYPGNLDLRYDLIDTASNTRVTVYTGVFFVSGRSSLRSVSVTSSKPISLQVHLSGDVSLFSGGMSLWSPGVSRPSHSCSSLQPPRC